MAHRLRLPTEVKRYYEGPLWSTARLIPGLVSPKVIQGSGLYAKLFAEPIGSSGNGFAKPLTSQETNMEEPGRIASGLAFTVYAVEWEVYYKDALDLREVCRGVLLTWYFLNTEIEIGMLGQAFGAQDVSTTVKGLHRGIFHYEELPMLLPANTQFSVRLYIPCGLTLKDEIQIRVSLQGVVTSGAPRG